MRFASSLVVLPNLIVLHDALWQLDCSFKPRRTLLLAFVPSTGADEGLDTWLKGQLRDSGPQAPQQLRFVLTPGGGLYRQGLQPFSNASTAVIGTARKVQSLPSCCTICCISFCRDTASCVAFCTCRTICICACLPFLACVIDCCSASARVMMVSVQATSCTSARTSAMATADDKRISKKHTVGMTNVPAWLNAGEGSHRNFHIDDRCNLSCMCEQHFKRIAVSCCGLALCMNSS